MFYSIIQNSIRAQFQSRKTEKKLRMIHWQWMNKNDEDDEEEVEKLWEISK